jgi:hypothetical protein
MSEQRKEAWSELVAASSEAVKQDFSKESGARLSNAAKAWAQANGFVLAVGGAAPGPARTSSKSRSGQVVPFGRSKGTPIEEADTKDLQWLLNAVSESVDDPSKERWREKNVALRDAIKAELEMR